MLFGLILDVFNHIWTTAGAMEPIHEAPGRKVASPTALAMQVLASRDTSEHNSRDYTVARERESFFQSDDGKNEEIRQEMCAEQDRG